MKGTAALSALAVFAVVGGGVSLNATSGNAAAAEDTPPSIVEDFRYPGAADILRNDGLELVSGDGHILYDSKRTNYPDDKCPVGLIQVEKELLDAEPYGIFYCFRTIGSKGLLKLRVPSTFGVRGGTEDLVVKAELPKRPGEPGNPTTRDYPVEPNQSVSIEPDTGANAPKAILVEIRMD